MLRNLKALHGHTVLANDGEIGKVYDFYFHDDTWLIRYLVVDTGHWLPGRKVLVTPSALGKPDWTKLTFPVSLTRNQVEKSPDIDTDMPVSRQQEMDLHNYYDWPVYWNEPGLGAPFPAIAPLEPDPKDSKMATKDKGDPHLRSVKEVTGYHIHASDGEMGHIADFIVDDVGWGIRYLVVATYNWLPAKKVLISPQWLGEIHHWERDVHVALTKDSILQCPEFHAGGLVNREYEERLHDYYGRPGYWAESDPPDKVTR
ncbi:MAG TPA: PRC-barrel domain-containing protein [Candidatus Baltobacteraceae bacterium]|jgi:hypothetical protein|nr:PRC-barrel domain-containing protein [Candidatus Baltobacteraceae bacterium]